MKYTYLLHRECWIEVEIEAENEDEAQSKYEDLEWSGELNDEFRNEILEHDIMVDEVWEGGINDGVCIYSAH